MGIGNGCGVYGSGLGVFGDSDSGTNAGTTGRNQGNGPGVKGESANSLGGYFVEGLNSIGALGCSANSAGLFGHSVNSIGFQGTSVNHVVALGYSPGVVGIWALSDTGTALVATSPVRAAQFDGPVRINGPLVVTGGISGVAATASTSSLPHADGSQRQTLGVRSRTSWSRTSGRRR